jgi:hypothetical protein
MALSTHARVALVRHPVSVTSAVSRVEAEVSMSAGAGLRLRYRVEGTLERVSVPAREPSARREGLWEHTCFEAFLSVRESPAYCEFNFSPSTEWAAWGFAAYRSGRSELPCRTAPPILVERSPNHLLLEAEINCVILNGLPGRGPLALGLSAVIEELDGRLSYWALAHPASQPDFHDPVGFVLKVPRPAEIPGGSGKGSPG